jgi:hypothetical protein
MADSATVTTLKARLDKLKRARSSGVHEVQFGDRRMRWRSDAELQRAIGALEQEIDALQGTASPRNLTVVANKGY